MTLILITLNSIPITMTNASITLNNEIRKKETMQIPKVTKIL